MVSFKFTLPFAVSHDRNVWQRLQTILDVLGAFVEAQQFASLPLTLGGLGLASAERTRHTAHWVSWADCLAMVQQRHPTCPKRDGCWIRQRRGPCLVSARHCREVLAEANFYPPSWRDLAVVVPERAEEVEPPAQVWLATARDAEMTDVERELS